MNIYIFSLIASIFFIAIILIFIKARALNFKYSIFGLLFGIIMIVLSADRWLTGFISDSLGITNPLYFLLAMGIVFVLISVLYIMVAVSEMQRKITRLVQEIAVIKNAQDKGDSK